MHLLFLANARMPTEKAHGFQIMKTIEALMTEGVEVDLLLPQRKNFIDKSSAEFYQLRVMPKIIVLKNPLAWLETTWKRLYFPLQRIVFGCQAWWFALSHRYDVIYSREITLCFFLQLLKPGKVVFEDHEPKQSFAGLYKFFVKHLSKKIVVAQGLKSLYETWGVKKQSYAVAPNGVDVTEFETSKKNISLWSDLKIETGKKIILYTGHFYEWKGVYTLLEAAPILRDHQIVLIGGTPEDGKSLQNFVQSHHLQNVIIHKFVPHQKIVQYIQSADVLVLPNTAKEKRSQEYTTPIKLFEYMASGVPLVASDLPSFRFYLKDGINATLCQPDSVADLAEKIQAVLHHFPEAQKRAAQAQQESFQFTWETRAQKILSFLKSSLL